MTAIVLRQQMKERYGMNDDFNGEFSETINTEINTAAKELADAFEEWSEWSEGHLITLPDGEKKVVQEKLVSQRGLKALGDLFGQVLPAYRANVFATLLVELEERNVPYNVAQFKAVH